MYVKKNKPFSLSFPTQGVLVLIFFIFLATFAIGIPSIWLIRDQLDRQAWDLVDQGSRMIGVLLDARNDELKNLVILTAQRPTLAELLARGDPENLAAYLETLRLGADLDLVMICVEQSNAFVQVGSEVPAQLCQNDLLAKSGQSPASTYLPGWLLASSPLPDDPAKTVVVGQALPGEFSGRLSDQIGMEHLLLTNQEPVAGSFPDNQAAWDSIKDQASQPAELADSTESNLFILDGTRYFAIRSAYGDTGLETLVLFSGSTIAETQQSLTITAVVVIAIVALLCSMLAFLLTKRISQPLEQLRDSAIALRKGDLETPVGTTAKVREIAEVAYALEDARIALHHTLEELRQEKTWGDYLLDSVVEGIITLDRRSKITFFSPGAERITGWYQDQVIGKEIDEIFMLPSRESQFSESIPEPGAKPEIVTILVNERPLTLTISRAQLSPPDAGKASMAISIRDISNEEAMRGLLGDFLANITHEFRTPLTALGVSIELLLDKLPELTLDEIRELLTSNYLGVLSLKNLIDNLLEGASIEAGRFQVSPRPIDLEEVIDQVAEMIHPLIEKNRQVLVTDLPEDLPLVQADPRRTSQVLINLLSNAIKWGPQGSEILLSATIVNNLVKVSIEDEGPGILPEHKHRLFSRFGHRQLEDGRAEYGAGLGLSVVKAIVESQFGQVGVEDREGRGAIFWFTTPIAVAYTLEQEGD